jgi:hypothetical protein
MAEDLIARKEKGGSEHACKVAFNYPPAAD